MFKEMSSINYVYSLGTGLDNITFYITFICRTFQIEHFSDMKLYLISVDKNHINIFVVDYLLSKN